ncbi:MAG: hypothetical protein J7J82_02525 [Staphylothermus sp.]|nr:hypothetical protein [Staphylothermus sp.]
MNLDNILLGFNIGIVTIIVTSLMKLHKIRARRIIFQRLVGILLGKDRYMPIDLSHRSIRSLPYRLADKETLYKHTVILGLLFLVIIDLIYMIITLH